MLTRREVKVLEALEEGPLFPKELYQKLGANTESQQANLRKVIKKLIEKGLVQRHPSPMISLTEKGRKALELVKLLEQ